MTTVLPPKDSERSQPAASASGAVPGLPHLRALDGLRGVAVLAVVLYHFTPARAPGGFLGVDVFFVLSGFLITSLLVNEWERRQHISLPRFWARRARRLLPALFIVLAVVGVYALFMSNHAEAHHIGEDGLATFGYFANWHYISVGQSYVERILQASPSPLRHTWSLAIEEQFYLVWPIVVGLVAAVVARVTGSRERNGRQFRYVLAAVCVALALASFVRMVTLFNSGGDANRVFYGTDTRAFLLLLGAVIGALSAGVVTISRRSPRLLVIAAGCIASGVLAVTMAKLLVTDHRLYEGGYGLIAVAIAVVLVAAAQPGPNPLGLVLRSQPLVGLGLISYGVYLWHWPITVWVTNERTGLDGVALFVLRSAITLGVSLASYVLVEQPIRRGWRPSWKIFHPLVAPAVIVVALVGLLLAPVLVNASVNDLPQVPPSASSASVTAAYAQVPRCDGSAAALTRLPKSDRPRVELFGNSVGIEARDCLRALVRARGGTFESVVHSGMPPCKLLPRLRAQVADPATRPDIAIFSAAIINVEPGCDPSDADWLTQVRAALAIWKAAGTHVYLVPIVPNIPGTGDPLPTDGKSPYVPAQVPEFRAFAAQDPAHITVVDAGMFIRDAGGIYQWRMPCLPRGEPGCSSDHSVGVRWVDGFHFCTDPHWNGNSCIPADRGGERRVGTAIALQITELSLTPTSTKTSGAATP